MSNEECLLHVVAAIIIASARRFHLQPGNYVVAPDDITMISTAEFSFGIVNGNVQAHLLPLKKGVVYIVNEQEVIVNPFQGTDSDDGLNTPMFISLGGTKSINNM